MLRQEGKVTRYTKNLDGDWNADHTEVTVSPLEDNPTQVNRDQGKKWNLCKYADKPPQKTVRLIWM